MQIDLSQMSTAENPITIGLTKKNEAELKLFIFYTYISLLILIFYSNEDKSVCKTKQNKTIEYNRSLKN